MNPIVSQRHRQQLDPLSQLSTTHTPFILRCKRCAAGIGHTLQKIVTTRQTFSKLFYCHQVTPISREVMNARCSFVVVALLFPTATICFRENIKTRMSSTAHDPCVACLGRIQVAKGSLHSSTRILCPVLLASPEHVFFHRLTLSLTVTPTTTRY